MKKILLVLLVLLPAILSAQTIQYSSTVPHTAGTPSGAPTTYGSWLRYDKTNKVLYRWTGAAWTAVTGAGVGGIYGGDGTIPGSTGVLATGAELKFRYSDGSDGFILSDDDYLQLTSRSGAVYLYLNDLGAVLGNTGNYYVMASPDNANSVLASPAGHFEATNNGMYLTLAAAGTAGMVMQDLRATPRGMQYAADYSAGFTSRSLVDKAYVDGAVSAGADGNGVYDGSGVVPTGTVADLAGTFRMKDQGDDEDIFNYSGTLNALSLGGALSGHSVTISAPEFYYSLGSGTGNQIVALTSGGLAVPVTVGSGLSWSGGTLSASGTAGHTIRDDGVAMTARSALNFVSSGTVDAAATDDAGNNETEVTFSIVSGSITATHLAANSVDASEIASGAVGSSEIATDAVGADEIATGAVGADEIASDAVGSAEIVTGAVGTGEILDGTIGVADLGQNSANTGDVLAWGGSAWAAENKFQVTVNAQTGTTYTLVLADKGKFVTLSNASAITLTVPTNASVAFPTGTVINICQTGAGQVTVSPSGGVTVSSADSKLKLRVQYSSASLIKTGTDTWILVGDLSS